ncbi:reprolysin-like metallopeptidase [Jiulongibacter sediminis]|uniref:Peptidase M12B domain-containing protein n=1 Tax=Jiulongibacter sediminis TaxID=1605367 RepID=A0A0P7BX75_9BACT|nr:3-coathanger stack domain-containing protein [Jiulongibacter sediminis]KPM49213.1 hypothetical protein AFM12_00805 [Jiulongibacter sediminis]TBX26268.1 hypothetical protein TK44_00805 [Jiulongibacter sediminis]
MKTLNLLWLGVALAFSNVSIAQDLPSGTQFQLDVQQLKTQFNTAETGSFFSMNLPLPDGSLVPYKMKSSHIMESQPEEIITLTGETADGLSLIRLSITPTGLTGIIRSNNAYFLIEPIDKKTDTFVLYNINDSGRGECNAEEPEPQKFTNENGKILSTGAFPIGSQMRSYRFAGAATGEMTSALGSQTAARDKIIAIMNATNLIYEVEASTQFSLIAKTTDLSLIFTNAATDPFSVNPNFGSANDSQNGFDSMNPGVLSYNEYDMGHTFNVISSGGARGTGGGSPCVDNSKSAGWTEFNSAASLGLIVGIFAHEVGHQFNAWHTYNAIGGSSSSPTFCTSGWSSTTAVEPGSGSTLMAYGNNCSNNSSGTLSSYVLTSPNNESYFHVKSLDQIFTKMSGVSNCFTTSATGNTPPVATVGSNATIPKGTPFRLTGSGSDNDAAANLSYAWEQIDVATSNDQGALGSSINGTGGYPAVNSAASAPLFRSKISSSPSRVFPDINFILNNANNPADNEGEDLPQVARTMNFRFTVRDNQPSGGGLDSEALVVTVSNTGPFEITSHSTTSTIAAGSSFAVAWAVNGTQALSANVKISMSVDGYDYPIELLASTPNDGSASVTIPGNFPATTKARIKISSLGGNGYEWFDVNNANLTITSACSAVTNFICPPNALTSTSGNGALNMGLGNFTGDKLNSPLTNGFPGPSSKGMYVYTDQTKTACHLAWSLNAIVVKIRVATTGEYTIGAGTTGSSSASTTVSSIYNSSTFSCSSFLGSNGSGAVSWSGSYSLTLNACTDYWVAFYRVFGDETALNATISGPGEIYNVGNTPAGFSYTYVAFNNSTGKAAAISSTSNFTSLGGGNFSIKGLLYENAFNPATYNGNSESKFYQSGSCMLFSSNTKPVTVIAPPCPTSTSLVSASNDISSGTLVYQTSNSTAPGLIQATNQITGGNVTYDAGMKVEMNPGFKVENAVFEAKIGGCN